MLRAYNWLCFQCLLLVMLRGPCVVVGIELGLTACKAKTLPLTYLFGPLLVSFKLLSGPFEMLRKQVEGKMEVPGVRPGDGRGFLSEAVHFILVPVHT